MLNSNLNERDTSRIAAARACPETDLHHKLGLSADIKMVPNASHRVLYHFDRVFSHWSQVNLN